mmetsp:Transcript_2859/g.4334  ORF Transcript_2859/g.4334 Transcript_2859/m.4334 type:complete len:203 (+) Transcript_2859:740-1348(+)
MVCAVLSLGKELVASGVVGELSAYCAHTFEFVAAPAAAALQLVEVHLPPVVHRLHMLIKRQLGVVLQCLHGRHPHHGRRHPPQDLSLPLRIHTQILQLGREPPCNAPTRIPNPVTATATATQTNPWNLCERYWFHNNLKLHGCSRLRLRLLRLRPRPHLLLLLVLLSVWPLALGSQVHRGKEAVKKGGGFDGCGDGKHGLQV